MLKLLRRVFGSKYSKPVVFPRMWVGGVEWNYRGPGIWQHVLDEELSGKPTLAVDNTTPQARLRRILATPVSTPL